MDYLLIDKVTGTVLAPEGCVMVAAFRVTDEVLSSDYALAELGEEYGIPLETFYDGMED